MGPSVLVWQSFHGWILSPASIIISPFGKFRRKSVSFMVFLSFFLRNLPFNLCPNVRFKMVYFPICKWTLEVVPMEHRWGLEALTCSAERSMPLPILIEHQETCHTASVLHHNISFFDNMATYGNIWQQYNQVLICSHHMRFPKVQKKSARNQAIRCRSEVPTAHQKTCRGLDSVRILYRRSDMAQLPRGLPL